MNSSFHFTFEEDWRTAPVAFWVHIPVPDSQTKYEPAIPPYVLHKGYAFLRVQYGQHELQFSSPAQLAHFIEVLARKPLPTSTQLSSLRKLPVGPNGHWLSRLPASLKTPRNRQKLVKELLAVQAQVVTPEDNQSFQWSVKGHGCNPR